MNRSCTILATYGRRRRPLFKFAFLLITLSASLSLGKQASWLEDASAIGIPAGTKAPPFELRDQMHRIRKLTSLMGRRGLVLVFIRSADW